MRRSKQCSLYIQNNHTRRERERESEVVIAKESEVLNEAAEIYKNLKKKKPQKCPIGCPRKSSILLQPQQIEKEKEDDEEHKEGNQHKRKIEPYNKWFIKEPIPPTERVVKKYEKKHWCCQLLETSIQNSSCSKSLWEVK